MTEATVRSILEREPFEPITIRMAGRTSHDISDPDSVTFPPGGGVMQIHIGGRLSAILSLDHIAVIETIPGPIFQSAD